MSVAGSDVETAAVSAADSVVEMAADLVAGSAVVLVAAWAADSVVASVVDLAAV